MRGRRVVLAAVAAVALATAGCAAMRVGSYVERRADFSRYRTYEWAAPDAFSTGDARLDNNTFFQERVHASVDTALAARGFEKVPPGTSDLVIHYHASVTQQVDVNGVDQKYGYCTDCRAFVFEAGTLTLDLIDRRTKTLVWRGWAEGGIDAALANQDWMERQVDEAVAVIVKRLPPRL
jgi:hypothetical protein